MRAVKTLLLPFLLLLVAVSVPAARGDDAPTDGTPLCGVEEPPPGTPVRADDGALSVATLNVLHAETDEGDESLAARLPLLAGAIVEAGADIVGAQEVTRNEEHGIVAQRLASLVAAATGEAWSWCWSRSNPHLPGTPDVQDGGGNPLDDQMAAFGNFPDEGDFSEGLAILSRHELEESRFRRLPPRSYEAVACVDPDPFCRLAAAFDSRQVLWARVVTPAGDVDMFTTHLAHGLTPLSDTTKLLQAQAAVAITEEWATEGPLPDFLVGDFNSAPGSAVHQEVVGAGFVDTYTGDETSGGPPDGQEVWSPSPERPMSERIDYVFARGAVTVLDSRRIADVPLLQPDGRYLWPSDHYGFVTTVLA